MSIEDEARAELVVAAERLKKYHGDGFIRSEFRSDMNTVLDSILLVDGAPRKASRKVEAAPSDTEREAVANALHADDCADDRCDGSDMAHYDRQAYLALETLSRPSQPVQVEVTDEQLLALQDLIDDNAQRSIFENVAVGNPRELAEMIVNGWLPTALEAALGGGEHAE